jgi:hypothetical protein
MPMAHLATSGRAALSCCAALLTAEATFPQTTFSDTAYRQATVVVTARTAEPSRVIACGRPVGTSRRTESGNGTAEAVLPPEVVQAQGNSLLGKGSRGDCWGNDPGDQTELGHRCGNSDRDPTAGLQTRRPQRNSHRVHPSSRSGSWTSSLKDCHGPSQRADGLCPRRRRTVRWPRARRRCRGEPSAAHARLRDRHRLIQPLDLRLPGATDHETVNESPEHQSDGRPADHLDDDRVEAELAQ